MIDQPYCGASISFRPICRAHGWWLAMCSREFLRRQHRAVFHPMAIQYTHQDRYRIMSCLGLSGATEGSGAVRRAVTCKSRLPFHRWSWETLRSLTRSCFPDSRIEPSIALVCIRKYLEHAITMAFMTIAGHRNHTSPTTAWPC